MSYYDRLQKSIQEQGINKSADALGNIQSKATDAFNKNVGNVNQLATQQIDEFMKTGGRHFAEHTGIKLANKYVVQPIKAKMEAKVQAQKDADSFTKENNVSGQRELSETGEGRLTAGTNEAHYDFGANDGVDANQFKMGADGNATDGRAVANPRVSETHAYSQDDQLINKESGLTPMEETHMGILKDQATSMEGEEVGSVLSKVSKIGDFLGPVGEIAQLGVMLGEGIKNAVEQHKNQVKDISGETQNIGAMNQAAEYAGMNRPSFGSMALPSFDTSKSSVMTQQ